MTKKRWIILGSCVLLAVILLVGFLMINRKKQDTNQTPYDISVSSEQGFVHADVDAIRDLSGVKEAVGVYEADTKDFYLSSFPKTMITPEITEGREPQKNAEIVLDERYALEHEVELGKVFSFQDEEGNEVEASVVGFAKPCFQIEDKYFLYRKLSAMAVDSYNCIYIRLEHPEDEEEVSLFLTELDAVCKEGQESRAAYLKAQAQAKVDDQKQLMDTLLDPAKEALDESQKELDNAIKKLDVNSSQAQLDDAQKALNKASSELQANRTKLDAAHAELNSAYSQLQQAKAQLEDGRSQLESARAQLASAGAELEANKTQYYNALSQAGISEGQIDEAINYYTTLVILFPLIPEYRERLASAKQLASARDQIHAAMAEFDSKTAEFNAKEADFQQQEALYNSKEAEYYSKEAELNSGEQQYQSAQSQLQAKQKEFEQKKQEFEKAQQKILSSQNELKNAQKDFKQSEQKYEDQLIVFEQERDEIQIGDWTIRKLGSDGRTMLTAGKQQDSDSGVWMNQERELSLEENYTVHVLSTRNKTNEVVSDLTGYYDGTHSHILIKAKGKEDTEGYYSCEDGTYTGYAWNEDPPIWVFDTVTASENYFYAYTIIERMQKLGAFIDSGELTYSSAEHAYIGENFSGCYVYDGKEHYVKSISIGIEDGSIRTLTEVYATKSGETADLYTDEIRFENIGITKVELPVNSISKQEIEETQESLK